MGCDLQFLPLGSFAMFSQKTGTQALVTSSRLGHFKLLQDEGKDTAIPCTWEICVTNQTNPRKAMYKLRDKLAKYVDRIRERAEILCIPYDHVTVFVRCAPMLLPYAENSKTFNAYFMFSLGLWTAAPEMLPGQKSWVQNIPYKEVAFEKATYEDLPEVLTLGIVNKPFPQWLAREN